MSWPYEYDTGRLYSVLERHILSRTVQGSCVACGRQFDIMLDRPLRMNPSSPIQPVFNFEHSGEWGLMHDQCPPASPSTPAPSYQFLNDVDRETRFDLAGTCRREYLQSIGEKTSSAVRWSRARLPGEAYRRYDLIVDGVKIGWAGTGDNGRTWHATVYRYHQEARNLFSDLGSRREAEQEILRWFSRNGAPL